MAVKAQPLPQAPWDFWYTTTDAKQIYGKVQVDIIPTKHLPLTYRMGYDYSDFDTKVGYPQIALDDALINDDKGYAPSNMNQAGFVATNDTCETNHIVNGNK